LEEIGDILSILCSSKLEVLLPQLSSIDMTVVMQAPSRRPSSLLLRKLDVASKPSGLVLGGLATVVGRRCTAKGSL
jgi:hypothetical protein